MRQKGQKLVRGWVGVEAACGPAQVRAEAVGKSGEELTAMRSAQTNSSSSAADSRFCSVSRRLDPVGDDLRYPRKVAQVQAKVSCRLFVVATRPRQMGYGPGGLSLVNQKKIKGQEN